MRYLALDIGSTSIKSALLDTNAQTAVVTGRASFPPSIYPPPRYEVDADGLFMLCKAMIDEGLDAFPDIKGILLSVQMHGCVVTHADGKPITGYISWRDALCAETMYDGCTYLEALRGMLPNNEWIRTGMPLKPKLALSSLYARIQNGLDIPEQAVFHTLGGFILNKLCGVHTCHLTTAASTGFCDVRDGTWSQSLIKAVGLDSLVFPNIEKGYKVLGEYHYDGRDYPLYPDMGDHQACVIGGALRPYKDIGVNIGTGGMVGKVTDEFTTQLESRPLIDGLYVETITGLPSGRHLQTYVDMLADAAAISGGKPNKDVIWSLITDPDFVHRNGSIDLLADFLQGDTLILKRIAEANSVANVTNALYKGMAECYAEATHTLGGGERLVYTGGAAERNPALRKYIEDACGIPGVAREGDNVMNGLLRLAETVRNSGT